MFTLYVHGDYMKGALEVLEIIYKHPNLPPKEIHKLRKTDLSTKVNDILIHLYKMGMVSKPTEYVLTGAGSHFLWSTRFNTAPDNEKELTKKIVDFLDELDALHVYGKEATVNSLRVATAIAEFWHLAEQKAKAELQASRRKD